MIEDDDITFDSAMCGRATSKMWLVLGQQITAAIPDIVAGGNPVEAIKWATCAEACFWKATGEGDTHDVKDVLLPQPPHQCQPDK